MSAMASASPPESSNAFEPEFSCVSIGDCEPCPDDHLVYPYCRPYNNRQAVKCSSLKTNYELSGWSACGKFVHAEVRVYSEFVLVNVALVIAALAIYIWRQLHQSRKYHGMLYQRVHGNPQARRNRTRSQM